MMKWRSFILILVSAHAFAQMPDTLVRFTPATGAIDFIVQTGPILPLPFDYTPWEAAQSQSIIALANTPPDSTPHNSGFVEIEPAANFFDLSDYPVSAAVQFQQIINDTAFTICSGVMAAPNYVLTAAHCFFRFNPDSNQYFFHDSIFAFPAFDNGAPHPLFGNSECIEYFIPKKYFDRSPGSYDVALIKLADPLGELCGWMGIGYYTDLSRYQNKVFHKLSYPGTAHLTDPTRVYNGDTLYYNYGTLDVISNGYLGFNLVGIPGQSGSPLFYAGNDSLITFGVLNWAAQSRHYRIVPEFFYAVEPIIRQSVSSIPEPINTSVETFTLAQNYPNPFNPETQIEFSIASAGLVTLKIYDISGKLVKTVLSEQRKAGNYVENWNGKNNFSQAVSSGVYFYQLQHKGFTKTRKMTLIR